LFQRWPLITGLTVSVFMYQCTVWCLLWPSNPREHWKGVIKQVIEWNSLHAKVIKVSQCTLLLKVILHQFWVKRIFPGKFNLEYGGTFTKLFMHVSSRNMFPTTRNLQICVHVYRPRHYCGDWLTFGCFVPMIADHNLVKKSFGPMIADHDLVKKR
jgi:hypothetical protein